jgi:hypothetical protein
MGFLGANRALFVDLPRFYRTRTVPLDQPHPKSTTLVRYAKIERQNNAKLVPVECRAYS